ncbi:pseudouridine synthase [Thermosulfuriphilus sp.]
MSEERLQKLISRAGIASRRKAEALIRAGRVMVDGRVVTELGLKVDPTKSRILVDGQLISIEPPVYLLLHKPSGYLTALSDPYGRRTIKDLIAEVPYRVFPVGRLDNATEGLLLLTNDGELANRLLHPRYGVEKVYRVQVKGHPSPGALRRLLEEGVEVEGRTVRPRSIKRLGRTRRTTMFEVVVTEGRKREIRRMFAFLGHPVKYLKRVRFGPLSLGDLAPGRWRYLRPEEIRALKRAAFGPKEEKDEDLSPSL